MLPKTTNINSGEFEGQDVLKEFQLEKLTTKQKSDPKFGLQISQKIWGYVTTGLGGYYYSRNAQFLQNRNYANGLIDVQSQFQDRLEMNGKQNYIKLAWQTLQIPNRIISGLVGRWMDRNEKIQVTATDPLSSKEKIEQYRQVEFILDYKDKLQALQDQTGVQFIPDVQLPSDKDQLLLWRNEFLRLPEEIETELTANEILQANGLFTEVKEIMLHDSAEVGLLGTYTTMDEFGVVKPIRIKPENAIYSYSEYNDFRDCTWMGHLPTIKISQLRRDYGKEFHPENPNALTEQEIWRIAQTSKDYNYYTNIQQFDTAWTNAFMRPYDEYNVIAMCFELKTVDTEPYTVTNTKSTGTTYIQKGLPTTSTGKLRPKPSDNQKILGDTNWNIYEGVYLPYTQTLLKWGIKKNMICPQDPKEVGNAEFSYSFYMYQNFLMRNMAIPQKIYAAIDNMTLACLKIQQVVARLVPNGWAIDETKLNNIDYGTGNSNNPVQHSKLFFQTGLLYYKGIDAQGNPDPQPPIKELLNNGFVGQMDGLIKTYQFWYQTLKDELGEDPNLIQSAIQPRVTEGNVTVAQQQSDYATDYMYRAYVSVMESTAKKVSCLMQDSIKFGAQVYRKITKQDDVSNRIYATEIQLLPTGQEIAKFEMVMNQALNTNPDLIRFVNPLQLSRLAKQDVKLAEAAFREGQKKCLMFEVQQQQQNQQATIQGQMQSSIASEKEKQNTENLKGQLELQKVKMQDETSNKNAVLTMVTSLLAKGEQIPAYLQPLVQATVENVMLPMVAENEQNKAEMVEQMRASLPQQGEQQPMQPQGGQDNEQQEQEQEQPEQEQQEQNQSQPLIQ